MNGSAVAPFTPYLAQYDGTASCRQVRSWNVRSPAWRLEMKARKSAIKDHWRCEYSFKPIAQDEWILFSLHGVDVKTPQSCPRRKKKNPLNAAGKRASAHPR